MKNKKTLFILVLVTVIVLIIVVSAVYFTQYNIKTIENFYDNDTTNINKIDIMDGSNGNIQTIVDKIEISNITALLSKMEFKKIHSEPSTGWIYSFSLYQDNDQKLEIRFLSENVCIFNNNGKKYSIKTSTDATIESLFNKVKKLQK